MEGAQIRGVRPRVIAPNQAPGTFPLNVDPSILALRQFGDNVDIAALDPIKNVLASTAFTNCFSA